MPVTSEECQRKGDWLWESKTQVYGMTIKIKDKVVKKKSGLRIRMTLPSRFTLKRFSIFSRLNDSLLKNRTAQSHSLEKMMMSNFNGKRRDWKWSGFRSESFENAKFHWRSLGCLFLSSNYKVVLSIQCVLQCYCGHILYILSPILISFVFPSEILGRRSL